jgi:hypothetical protein
MRILLLAAALALGAAAPAGAATVDVEPGRCQPGSCDRPTAIVTAAPGERNDLRQTPGEQLTLHDASAPLRSNTPQCRQVDEHTVKCMAGATSARLGDGDDRAEGVWWIVAGEGDDVVTGARTVDAGPGDDEATVSETATGGAGNDRLTMSSSLGGGLAGDEGDDHLIGSDQDTRLDGGPGSDVLEGRGGNDTLIDSDAGGTDRHLGGEGRDILRFDRRTDPVAVDLAAQTSSDGDALSDIEDVAGGAGNDTLTGSEGPNVLEGEAGQDTLTGRDGADKLDGGAGYDVFDAGAGNDFLIAGQRAVANVPDYALASDAPTEILACGDGVDSVGTIEDDFVRPDCERVGYARAHPLQATFRRATFFVPCPPLNRVKGRCRGTLRLDRRPPSSPTASGPAFQMKRFSVPRAGGRVTLRVPPLTSVMTVTLRYPGGATPDVARWRIVLPAPGSGSPGG